MTEQIFSCIRPEMSVSEAATVLERLLRQRLGSEYERLYRSVAFPLGELTDTDASQFFSIIVLIGQAQDQLTPALGLIWLATKNLHDPLMQQLMQAIRETPVEKFLQKTRAAVQAAKAALEEEGGR